MKTYDRGRLEHGTRLQIRCQRILGFPIFSIVNSGCKIGWCHIHCTTIENLPATICSRLESNNHCTMYSTDWFSHLSIYINFKPNLVANLLPHSHIWFVTCQSAGPGDSRVQTEDILASKTIQINHQSSWKTRHGKTGGEAKLYKISNLNCNNLHD